MQNDSPDLGHMVNFGGQHFTMLAITVVALYAVLRAAGRGRITDSALTRAGWILLVITIAWTSWDLLPNHFDPKESFPFQLSDTLRFATAYALITRKRWACALTYYNGLSLNLTALLTPDCSYSTFPPLEFTMYWFLHISVLLGPVALVSVGAFKPSWSSLRTAFGITLLWAVFTGAANLVLGANYGYLSAPPPQESPLDAMGPWPQYLFVGAGILVLFWAIALTVPFYWLRGRDEQARVRRLARLKQQLRRDRSDDVGDMAMSSVGSTDAEPGSRIASLIRVRRRGPRG